MQMTVDPTGQYWRGQGTALKDRDAMLHLRFTYDEQAVDLSLPASVLVAAAESGSHAKNLTGAMASFRRPNGQAPGSPPVPLYKPRDSNMVELTRFRGHLNVRYGGVYGGAIGPVHAGV